MQQLTYVVKRVLCSDSVSLQMSNQVQEGVLRSQQCCPASAIKVQGCWLLCNTIVAQKIMVVQLFCKLFCAS